MITAVQIQIQQRRCAYLWGGDADLVMAQWEIRGRVGRSPPMETQAHSPLSLSSSPCSGRCIP